MQSILGNSHAKARQWLDGQAAAAGRSLAKFRTPEAARRFVELLYRAGSPSVVLAPVYADNKGKLYADWMVVGSPKAAAPPRRLAQHLPGVVPQAPRRAAAGGGHRREPSVSQAGIAATTRPDPPTLSQRRNRPHYASSRRRSAALLQPTHLAMPHAIAALSALARIALRGYGSTAPVKVMSPACPSTSTLTVLVEPRRNLAIKISRRDFWPEESGK